LYLKPNIIRGIKVRRKISAEQRKSEICMQNLVGKPEGRLPLGRLRRMWEGNIEMYFKYIGLENADRIHLAQGRDQWWALSR
jgi:hypothetical protein